MMFTNNTKCSKNVKSFSILFILMLLAISIFSFTVSADVVINTYPTAFDFSSNVPTNLNICSCGDISSEIVIVNTGNFVTNFEIRSNQPKLLQLSNYDFNLNPGQKIQISLKISVDCKFENEEILVTVKNGFNVEKDYLINVQGNICQNLAANLIPSKDVINPFEMITYNLTVQNAGNFEETYYFNLGKYNKFATSEYGSVTLQPNQIGNFKISFNFPPNYNGDFVVPINVYTSRSKLGISFDHNLTVLNNYDFSTDISDDIFSCAEDESLFKFTINNDAVFDNTFFIESLSPDFIILNTKKVSLGPNNSTEVEFIVKKTLDNIGEHDLLFQVTSELGGLVQNVTTSLYTNKCYDLGIKFDQDYHEFCGDIYNIPFSITNYGAITQNVNLIIPGFEGQFEINQSNITLEHGEKADLLLDISNISYVNKKYSIPIIAELSSNNIRFEKDITIDFTTPYFCNNVMIEPTFDRVNYDDNITSFNIKNIGYKSLVYNVTITPRNIVNSSWIKYSDNFQIFLNPGDEEEIYLNLDENRYYAEQGNYLFDISMVPLYINQNLNYDYVFNLQLKDKSVFYYVGLWIYSNPILTLIFIIIILLILFFLYLLLSRPKTITVQDKRKKKRKPLIFGFIIFALLFLILLLLFCPLKSIYPAVDNNDTQLSLSFYAGDVKEIDFGNYFVDPDGDVLNYTALFEEDVIIIIDNIVVDNDTSSNDSMVDSTLNDSIDLVNNSDDITDNTTDIIDNNIQETTYTYGSTGVVSVEFKDNKAFIYSLDNFSGVVPIWFYATDFEEVVESEVFLLNIIEKPKFVFMDYVYFYMCYIIWFIAVIIILIYVLVFLKWTTRRTKRQHLNDKKKKKE